jgi:hypothetical protein
VAESTRLAAAQELRKKADRYRELARWLVDARAAEITERMSRECDERADEIEREILEQTKADRSHAA